MRCRRNSSTSWGWNGLTDEDHAAIRDATPDDLEAAFSRHHRSHRYTCQLMRNNRGVTFGTGLTAREAFDAALRSLAEQLDPPAIVHGDYCDADLRRYSCVCADRADRTSAGAA